uniref:Uncharacterized protein n=1 Tax=Rhizophora mucronata TaxID=61149 RepID=A0A2P2MXU4_RHIMU
MMQLASSIHCQKHECLTREFCVGSLWWGRCN